MTAVVADRVIVELEAKLDKYEANVRRAEQKFDKGMRAIRKSSDRTAKSIERNNKQIANTFRTLAGTIATAFSAREITQLIDGYTRLQNNLKVVGLEGQNLAAVQNDLRAIGAQYGVEVEALSNVFLKASLAQQSLGASTEDIIDLNRVVAASLKITGTSSEQARGALLQLGQALGSGVVRAEEFNSILEGALPIAQAAARGIEGFGGDVAKLRIAVTEGNISSRQFFDGIKAGSEITLAQAEKATLTLAGAFTVLRNELTLYVGDAAETSGATEALSSAIRSLADNLDVIVPALIAIAGVMSARFVTGLVAGSAALRAITAHMAIATTGMAGMRLAAASAGGSLLAAFGGPVGVAILAVGAAIAYVASEAASASAEIAALEGSASKAEQELADLENRARAAGLAVEDTGSAADAAGNDFFGLGKVLESTIGLYQRLTKNARIAAIAVANADLQRARSKKSQLRARLESSARLSSGAAEGVVVDVGAIADAFEKNQGGPALDREIRALEKRVKILSNLTDADFAKVAPSGGGGGAAAPKKKTKKARGRKPPKDRSAEIALRALDEQNRLDQEVIQAKIQLATNVDDRADLEYELLALERQARVTDIIANKDLTAKQKDAQLAIITELYGVADQVSKNGEIVVRGSNGLFQQAIQQEVIARELQERADLERAIFDAAREALEDELDIAVTQDDRRRILLDLVELEFSHRKAALEALIASEVIAEAEKERAKIALDALEKAKAAQIRRAERDSERPLEKFRRELDEAAATVDEQIEGYAVDALKDLNSGLAEAIVNGESLGDVLESTAKRFLAQLIELTIQLLIIKPLLDSIGDGFGGGGGSGGGIGGIIAGLFGVGRASGGNVVAGQTYRVNEGGGIEGFRAPGSGTIIPLGQMNKAQPDGSGTALTVSMPISVVAPGANAQTVELIRQTIADTAPSIVQAAQKTTVQALTRKRITR